MVAFNSVEKRSGGGTYIAAACMRCSKRSGGGIALLLPASFEEIWRWHCFAAACIIRRDLVVTFHLILPGPFDESWCWHSLHLLLPALFEESWWWHSLHLLLPALFEQS